MKHSKHEWKSNILPALVTVSPVAVCMLFLVLIPLVYVVVMSFCSIDEYYNVVFKFTLKNYIMLADPQYTHIYLQSLLIAFLTTLVCILIAYPFSFLIARTRSKNKNILYMLVIIPFWTNFLIRTYSWIVILQEEGLINSLLLSMGIIRQPLNLLYTMKSIMIGMVYGYLPFMVLPLYAVLERQQHDLLEAAADLGCTPFEAFWRVTFPLSLPGVAAGALLCFIPMVGEFVIPDLLGGPDALTIGRVLWTEFFTNRDWPLASAVAMAMLALIVVPTLLFEYFENRREQREASA